MSATFDVANEAQEIQMGAGLLPDSLSSLANAFAQWQQAPPHTDLALWFLASGFWLLALGFGLWALGFLSLLPLHDGLMLDGPG